jgi:hypothetical protein
MMKRRGSAYLLAAFSLAYSSAAAARPKAEAVRLIDAVIQCDAISDPTSKLTCFENAVRNLKAARASSAAVLQVEEKRRPEFKELDSKVLSVTSLEAGKWLMVLADHSVWQNADVGYPPERGDPVHITKGSFGSFFGTIANGKAVRLKRLR